MQITININEDEITEIVKNEIVKLIVNDFSKERYAQYGVRDGLEKGIKNYIYKEKDKIIERVVERASKYVVKQQMDKKAKAIKELLEGIPEDLEE